MHSSRSPLWRRLLQVCAGIALAAAALLLALWQALPPDPIHRGRAASLWIQDLGAGGDKTEEAKRAILEMKADAAPQLDRHLRAGRSRVARSAWLARVREALPARWQQLFGTTTSSTIHLEILQLAPQLGSASAGLVPALALNTQPSADLHHHFAIQSLGKMGANGVAAVPALLEVLNGNDEIARRSATLALARIGQLDRPALNRVRTLVKDANPWVSNFASLALWKIDFSEETESALLSTMEHLDLDSRILMMNLAVELYPKTEAAQRVLERQVNSPTATPTIRAEAERRLRQLSAAKATPP